MSSIKVLLVEDELLIAKNTKRQLEKLEYVVTDIASSGGAAIDSISLNPPDIILMDIAIKGNMNGVSTAKEILAIQDIPIIYLTAYADESTIQEASQTSSYGYLIKPFNIRELHATLQMVVNKHQEQLLIEQSLRETVNQYSSEYNDIYKNNLTNLPNKLFLRDLFTYLLSSLETEDSQPNKSQIQSSDSSLATNPASDIVNSESERQKLLAVLYLQLDRFHKICEAIDNNSKNILLQNIAKRLTNCVESLDFPGTTIHLEVNEFVIMFAGFTRRQIINEYAEKIIGTFTKPFAINQQEVFFSTSIGISFYPFDSLELEKLLQQAKQAMTYAHKQGINRHHWYTLAFNIQSTKATDEIALETELHYALQKKELEVYYQPKIDLITNKIVGTEALIRWNHPEMGLISPERFLPIAEESGLIQPISEWILTQACRQTKAWHDAGFESLTIAVNLSGRQFKQSDLFHKITQILFNSRIEPHHLELELTEKILIDNIKANVQRLKLIKKTGIQIALDDFGTGYSSLEYLQQFPFDILKIDRCFIRNINRHNTNAVITQAIIQMAHQLGLKVVAEGVETEAELEFLKANKCDEVQGFLFSRPLSAKDFSKLLMKGKL